MPNDFEIPVTGVWKDIDGFWHARCRPCLWETMEVLHKWRTPEGPQALLAKHCKKRSHRSLLPPTRGQGARP